MKVRNDPQNEEPAQVTSNNLGRTVQDYVLGVNCFALASQWESTLGVLLCFYV